MLAADHSVVVMDTADVREVDSLSDSGGSQESMPGEKPSSWVDRRWGGWLRALVVAVLAASVAAKMVEPENEPTLRWLMVVAVVLCLLAGIAILFNPVDPDRSVIAALILALAAQLAAIVGGGNLAVPTFLAFLAYEAGAYSSRRVRPWLGFGIFGGSAAVVVATSILSRPWLIDPDSSLLVTVGGCALGIVMVWIAPFLAWYYGLGVRGKRRPAAS